MSTCACGHPVIDAHVCSGCTRRLEAVVASIPDLNDDLDLVIARQTRYAAVTERVGGTSETPVAFHVQAAEVQRRLKAVLTTWCLLVWEERYDGANRYGKGSPSDAQASQARGGPDGLRNAKTGVLRDLPADATPAIARWLLERPAPNQQTEIEWLRHHAAGAEAVTEITDAVNDARRVTDAPLDRTTIPIGACTDPSCTGQLRAHIPREESKPGVIRCTGCEQEWDATQWAGLGRRLLRASTSC